MKFIKWLNLYCSEYRCLQRSNKTIASPSHRAIVLNDTIDYRTIVFSHSRPVMSRPLQVVTNSHPELSGWRSPRMTMMRIIVLHPCTTFEVRRSSHSEDMADFSVTALSGLVTLTFDLSIFNWGSRVQGSSRTGTHGNAVPVLFYTTERKNRATAI